MEDRTKILTDAALVGAINLVAMYMAHKIYPNNFLLQAFISGSIIHISMNII